MAVSYTHLDVYKRQSTRGYYYVSGWVYGITPSNSTEFFPYNYMSDYTVSDGMKITMHYSVTGPYNIETGNWTSDYSNLDVTMWNLYDKIAALDPNYGFGALSYTTGTVSYTHLDVYKRQRLRRSV